MRGVSERHLYLLLKSDTTAPTKTERRGGTYVLEEVGAWLMKEGRKGIATAEDGKDYDLNAERARLAAEQADGQALKNSILRNESAPTDALAWALSRLGEKVKAQLSTLPGAIKRQLPMLGQAEMELVRREIAIAMNTIAETSLDLNDYQSLRRTDSSD